MEGEGITSSLFKRIFIPCTSMNENRIHFDPLLVPHRCSCGKEHSCEIKSVQIGKHALAAIPALTAAYHHILLVADENTYAVCGEEVTAALGERRQKTLIYHREGLLVPNEEAIAELSAALTEESDLIVGIGSGVIQDLCKYVSFEAGLAYHIVATAPSMDGYASKGAAMILENMKITVNTHVPEVIYGDLDVLKNAPMEMIQSGYGDILGKFSCLNDWKLAALVENTFFCQEIYDMTWSMLQKTKDLGQKLLQREEEAIAVLMEALVGVGIAMAFAGNSCPASGSEHHLSHFFEVTGLLNQQDYFPHGIDVAYSTIYTERLREELLQLSLPLPKAAHDDGTWRQNIAEIYGKAADGVMALQDQLGRYQQDRVPFYTEHWETICGIMREVPSSRELLLLLEEAGLKLDAFDALYGEEKIRKALLYAKDLKDRYTVLWLYYDLLLK